MFINTFGPDFSGTHTYYLNLSFSMAHGLLFKVEGLYDANYIDHEMFGQCITQFGEAWPKWGEDITFCLIVLLNIYPKQYELRPKKRNAV